MGLNSELVLTCISHTHTYPPESFTFMIHFSPCVPCLVPQCGVLWVESALPAPAWNPERDEVKKEVLGVVCPGECGDVRKSLDDQSSSSEESGTEFSSSAIVPRPQMHGSVSELQLFSTGVCCE